jgi:1-acyl-sn-glycerol-3-phosphate acyltransferase
LIFLRSLAFNLAFYVWTTANMLAALPIVFFTSRIFLIRWMALWARGVFAAMRVLAGITVEIRGRQHLPEGACIIAAKHQSAWDTLAFHVAVPDPAMVMKQELMWIPIYGAYSRRAGMIAVNRTGGASALRAMLKAARSARDLGRQIVIFPQGTRVSPDAAGADIPYQAGVAALYRDLGLAVVPVAVNSGQHWPRRKFIRPPGKIVLEFLPPIPPGLDRDEFMGRLHQAIEPATLRLLAVAE